MQNPQQLGCVQRYLTDLGTSVQLVRFLGEGTDGAVWATSRDTAVKALFHPVGYANERDTYLRLAEYGIINKLNEFWVPRMIGNDDDLMVVEMHLMQEPPFVIDFAKVRIDRPPEFSDDVLDYQDRRGREEFGDENWMVVQRLLAALESLQIYYLDPRPHNIVFPGCVQGTLSNSPLE